MEGVQCLNSLAEMSQPQTLRDSVSTVLEKFQQPEKAVTFYRKFWVILPTLKVYCLLNHSFFIFKSQLWKKIESSKVELTPLLLSKYRGQKLFSIQA